jgi:hypothetical protein
MDKKWDNYSIAVNGLKINGKLNFRDHEICENFITLRKWDKFKNQIKFYVTFSWSAKVMGKVRVCSK